MKLIVPLTFLLFVSVVMVWLMSGAQAAQVQQEADGAPGKVTELMSKNLPDFPGKEGVMVTVEYPPGGSDPIHRHNADVFVYVLEGSIVMQLRGGEETTLTPGQTFYEGPDDVHVVTRNASATGEIPCVLREGYRCTGAGACQLKPLRERAILPDWSSKEDFACATTAIPQHSFAAGQAVPLVAHAYCCGSARPQSPDS